MGGSFGTYKRAALRMLVRSPMGTLVRVFYDPESPSTACLERRSPNATMSAVVGAVSAVGGLAIVVASRILL